MFKTEFKVIECNKKGVQSTPFYFIKYQLTVLELYGY